MANVLVVDDEMDTRQILAAAVRELGHTAIEAVDGEEAIRTYHQHHPAAVILDLHLPLLSGYDVLARIREDGTETPVIVVSGSAAGRLSLQLGADTFLSKPFSVVALQRMVNQEMRRRHS